MNRKLSLLALLLVACGAFSFAADSSAEHKPVGGGCDGCELMFEGMPKTLHSETTILGADGGEPMEIEGVIYQEDGKTPAPDVILPSITPTRAASTPLLPSRPPRGVMDDCAGG